MAVGEMKKPSIEVLRIAIDEQRREHDELTSAFERLRFKILTLLGGGLALLTFLYSNPNPKNPLFLPSELYGKIFYFAGLVLIVGALSALLHATRPSGVWEVAPEADKLKRLSEDDQAKYLAYVSKRYLVCYKNNCKEYSTKHKFLNMSFYPLVFGAIILIVIKLFGGLPR